MNLRGIHREAFALLAWVAAWTAMFALEQKLDLANLAILMVLASALSAMWLPGWASVIMSAAAVMAFNWLVLFPWHPGHDRARFADHPEDPSAWMRGWPETSTCPKALAQCCQSGCCRRVPSCRVLVAVAHPIARGAGLFNGLADPRIAKALVAMHERPAFGWDLELLAQEAGMSRTAFATKFHQTMRRPPGKYLSAIRLALAQRAVDLGKGLKEAARAAGYESSSALSRALTRSRML
jgi:AraC-like DNA-binding protein